MLMLFYSAASIFQFVQGVQETMCVFYDFFLVFCHLFLAIILLLLLVVIGFTTTLALHCVDNFVRSLAEICRRGTCCRDMQGEGRVAEICKGRDWLQIYVGEGRVAGDRKKTHFS